MHGQTAYRIDHALDGDLAQQRVLGLLSTLGVESAPDSAPVSEPPPSSGRSEAETMPYAAPFSDGSSSPFTARGAQDWCVDVGHELRTMSTFELWQAIERAEVLAPMRVWREGMECWTPIGDLAEFSLALASARTPEPASIDATPGPAKHALTPAPAELDHADGSARTPAPPANDAAPRSGLRPFASRLGGAGGARWIGLGSAVALTAIVSALLVSSTPAPAPAPREARVAVQGAAPIAAEGKLAPASADEPLAPALDDRPAEPPTRHAERGQRRMSRGGRAQGR
jgi:hypothetical protein